MSTVYLLYIFQAEDIHGIYETYTPLSINNCVAILFLLNKNYHFQVLLAILKNTTFSSIFTNTQTFCMINTHLSRPGKRAMLACFLLLTIFSCNKNNNTNQIHAQNKINDVGTPPPFIAWVKGNDIPVRDGIPG